MPKSSANTAICEVTISPEVDIIAIMTNISQNSGWRSISRSKRSAALHHRLTDGLGDSGRRQLQPLTGEEADEGEKDPESRHRVFKAVIGQRQGDGEGGYDGPIP